MRRHVAEVQVRRQPARPIVVGVVAMGVIAGELPRDKTTKDPRGRVAAARHGHRRDGVIDGQCRQPLGAGRQQAIARRRPSASDRPWQRREPGDSPQAAERRFFGNLGQMVAQHPLNKGTIEAGGGEGTTVFGERDQAVRIDRLEPDHQPRGGRLDHPRQKERRVPVGDDDARIRGQGCEQFAPVAA